jgi:riboflavin kinase/FMN adenylyltransferase
MQKIERLDHFTSLRQPLVLTIGNFDGMHRGHQAVLQRVLSLAGSEGQTAVITFSNHPSDVLRPEQPTLLLCTLPHRLRLIEDSGIDTLILLPFTRYLAQHSAASFIEHVRRFIPFSHLVLGYDATLGRDRQGDRSIMMNLGDQWGFSVHYLEEYRYEGHPISSTTIRDTLQKGDLERVEQLLARPFSIYVEPTYLSEVENNPQVVQFSVDVKKLCLPPDGVYEVELLSQSQRYDGIATLSQTGKYVMNISVNGSPQNLNPLEFPMEVIFHCK